MHQELDSPRSLESSLRYGVALTGGIACGKSSVARLLRERGFPVVCADTIAHKVLEECAKELIATFDRQIVSPPESSPSHDTVPTINRKALGAIVFNDRAQRLKLESITHPRIRDYILQEARSLEARGAWYFLDIPLFFESGGRARYDVRAIICVSATEATQLARLKQRDTLSAQEARQRIHAQLPLAHKVAHSTLVIENNSSQKELATQVDNVLHKLKQYLPPSPSSALPS